MSFVISSSAFHQDHKVPHRYTCDGLDVSPALTWTDPPAGTQAFALVVDDPDAPAGTFTHWLLSDISVDKRSIAEGQSAGLPGTNDFGRRGYGGPCPPRGHGRHRYRFQLHALSRPLGLPAGFSRSRLDGALEGRVLETAVLTGWYERT